MNSPLVIPFFIPHQGCPHRCSFCSQSLITGVVQNILDPAIDQKLDRTINEYLSYKKKRSHVELAFFGGNFLGLPLTKIKKFLDIAQNYMDKGLIHGLRCSTRPDTITTKVMNLISAYDFSLIELGVQSMNDRVLARTKRGHTKSDTLRALDIINSYGINSGVQIMIGLPGETESSVIEGVYQLINFNPATARIYPLLVLTGTDLANLYKKGEFFPLTLTQAVSQSKKIFKIFNAAGIRVIRMGLQSSDMLSDKTSILAGPWHPAFGHLVLSSIMLDKVINLIRICIVQNIRSNCAEKIILIVNSRSESRLRGEKNSNIKYIGQQFPGIVFSIQTSADLPVDQVKVKPLP